MKIRITTVIDILMSEGTAASIAKEFGVSQQTVRLYKSLKVKRAKNCLQTILDSGRTAVLWGEGKHRKFSDLMIENIRASDESSKVQSMRYGCSASMIRMIKTGKAYNG